jgi:hypothetical protein
VRHPVIQKQAIPHFESPEKVLFPKDKGMASLWIGLEVLENL